MQYSLTTLHTVVVRTVCFSWLFFFWTTISSRVRCTLINSYCTVSNELSSIWYSTINHPFCDSVTRHIHQLLKWQLETTINLKWALKVAIHLKWQLEITINYLTWHLEVTIHLKWDSMATRNDHQLEMATRNNNQLEMATGLKFNDSSKQQSTLDGNSKWQPTENGLEMATRNNK